MTKSTSTVGIMMVVALAAVLALPGLASAQTTTATAPLAQPVMQQHSLAGVIGGGVTVFTAGWAASMALGVDFAIVTSWGETFLGVTVAPHDITTWSMVPFIGPFVMMSIPGWRDQGYALLLADGLVQLTGLAMVIAGIVGVELPAVHPTEGTTLTITPSASPTSASLSATLTF